MSSTDKNLSLFNPDEIPSAKDMRFGVVVSEWNNEITFPMWEAASSLLKSAGCPPENIIRTDVPGAFELPLGAKFLLDRHKPDAVICIGCVVRGETRHFDFICGPASSAIMQLGLQYNIPVIFGVLTTDTLQQAKDRSGGKFGNKGTEAAVTAIRMAYLKKSL